MSNEYYAGMITVLAVVHAHNKDVVFDEVMGEMDYKERDGMLNHARANDEYEWAGFAAYEKRKAQL